MKFNWSLLFVPHEKNNHRAVVLQPIFLIFLILIYLANQLVIKSITIAKPGVLGYSSEITIQKVVEQTNFERQKFGLPNLFYNSVLSESAKKKAADMFKNNYWSHNSPTNKTPWDFMGEVGYQYSVAGENLAKDFYNTDSMLKAWMNSPSHKANIMHDKYQEIGVAVTNGVLNGVKTTLVVQHFGTPLNQVVLSTAHENISPNTPSNLESPSKAISPLMISKIIGFCIFSLIIVVLVLDSYLTLKTNTRRLTGSSASHIGFLFIILLFLIFSQSGSIF